MNLARPPIRNPYERLPISFIEQSPYIVSCNYLQAVGFGLVGVRDDCSNSPSGAQQLTHWGCMGWNDASVDPCTLPLDRR